MNITATDGRGTLIKGRDIWRVDNALVEEVSTNNGRTGTVLISYVVRQPNNLVLIESLRLIISGSTVLRNQRGLPVGLRDIRPGMRVDAELSPAMTHSEPPQANALRIVLRGTQLPQFPQFPQFPPPQRPPQSTTFTGRVLNVDVNNRMITAGIPFNAGQQMRFVVTDETIIQNRNGRRIPLRMLRPGQTVEVVHATFQTMSIPPQSTAFRIRVL